MIKIIIAEDDYRIAQIHEAFIERIDGLDLMGKAKNAEETIEMLNMHEVDLILLDIYMPDRLGTDLLHQIRSDYPGVDIIMITAAKEKPFIRKAMEYGVFRYLIKPLQLEEFTEAIEEYKKFKEILNEDEGEIEAGHLQKLFSYNLKEEKNLPTGIDSITLGKVVELIEMRPEGLTSEQVGSEMGASRTTARRYLEYLVGTGKARAESVYGIVGRPERKYFHSK